MCAIAPKAVGSEVSLQAGQGCMLNIGRWWGDFLALSCIKTSLCRLSPVHSTQLAGASIRRTCWRDRILDREFCAFIRAAFVQMQLLSLQCGGCSDGNDWRRGVAGEACLSHQGRCCWKTQRFSSEVKHTCATASAPSIGEWGIAEPVCCRRSSPGKGGCAPGLVSLGLSCAFRVWLSTIQFLICQDRGHG